MKRVLTIIKKAFPIFILVVVLFIVFVLKPALINREMNFDQSFRINRTDLQSRDYSASVYYQEAADPKIKRASFIKNKFGYYCYDQKDQNQECINNHKIRILSTQDDQELLTKSLESKWPGDKLNILYQDLNDDNIQDLILLIGQTSKRNTYYEYAYIYSAHNGQVLWVIEDRYDDFLGSLLDIRFLDNSSDDRADTIVIYNKATKPQYSFYQSVNSVYQEVDPTQENWTSYWRMVSLGDLFVSRILNTFGFLFIIIIFIYLIAPIIIVVAIIKSVDFIRSKFIRST